MNSGRTHSDAAPCRRGMDFRRRWMLGGFAAAFLIGDYFLAVRGASVKSAEFLYGVAGFSLAQILWTAGQLREARPDWRIFLAAALPLAAFILARLHPPVLPPAATAAAFVYSLLTELSLATALVTRRVFYVCGIGLLLFSDLMICGRLVRAPGCGILIGPTYLAAEACLLASFFLTAEWRIPYERCNIWRYAIIGGAAAFGCFAVAAFSYPGGGYNPFMQMLSALGRTVVKKVTYPPCHYWFMAGLLLASVSAAGVWARLARRIGCGWRHFAVGWGGAVNVAGLCIIVLVPENTVCAVHNIGCNLAVAGGLAVLAARLRRGGGDWGWLWWFAALVSVFLLCLGVEAIPFSPWVTTFQKLLIVSFAVWLGWIAWRLEDGDEDCMATEREMDIKQGDR